MSAAPPLPCPSIPHTIGAPAQSSALHLEISIAEAWPWPGAVVRAAARVSGELWRLGALKPCAGGFYRDTVRLEAGPELTLLVRTLTGLPSADGIALRAEGPAFGPVLTMLRGQTPGVRLTESSRIAACRVLTRAPLPGLRLEALPSAEWAVRAIPNYHCPDSGLALGLPLLRRETWAFDAAVAPAPELPLAPLLEQLFKTGTGEFAGAEARALLRAAWAARPALRLSLPVELEAAARAQGLLSEPDGAASRHAFHGETAIQRPIESIAGTNALRHTGTRSAPQPIQHERGGLTAGRQETIPPAEVDSPWNQYISAPVAGAQPVADDAAELRARLGAEDGGANAWFELNGAEGPGTALSEEEIRRLLRQRKAWKPARQPWSGLGARGWEAHSGHAWGSRHGRYGTFEPAAEERGKVEALFSLARTTEHGEKYDAFIQRLREFGSAEETPLPAGLRLQLRPYQATGYHWLCFLSRYGLNGILADEMGLGKTLQTLAWLLKLKAEHGPLPALIVCPTSLVDNWCAEIRKAAPGLSALRYRGSPARRDRLRREIADRDVVLATYATARNDAKLLEREHWRCVVLDEAHVIKNASAATTKALKTIPARHRLALTGTPVQNALGELWSIVDFLMPGFLGRHAAFYRRYEEPIVQARAPAALATERERGAEAEAALRERIGPFVMRREKAEVARDLPEKIEQHIPCALSADQVALYERFGQSDEARGAVRGLEEHGPARAQVQILAALTALRKVCNHPDLVYLSRELAAGKRIVPLPGYEARSGKLEALGELLETCRAGGHRALLFCQMTSMLDILEHYLAHRQIACLRLDGATPGPRRLELVQRFNAAPDIPVFLISTRAGGCGLNLTGADRVIFYDHDWNPANDLQAQDRAYRIGQTRNVHVYRLVTQGTFEQRILERQALKLSLADAIIRPGAGLFQNITREELLALFAFTPPERE